ncbi:hypothetical protein TrCOL_g5627 [Triparma columacea]|uniref:Uncharacterized protein n=1 Tax=Triparma columacea TaxID=722753 RepID=A0A9W7L926_9STRA|nr:hypothetical protein TrCOL_g5627 [Triparma columacea]
MSRDDASTKERRSPKIAAIAPMEDAQITLEDDEIKGRAKELLFGSQLKINSRVRCNITEALWAVGCMPKVETMHGILNAPDLETCVSLFTEELVRNRVGVRELEDKVQFFLKMKRLPMRPEVADENDPYTLQKQLPWFIGRLFTAFVPGAPIFTTKYFFPQFTPREKSVYFVSSVIIGVVLAIAIVLWGVNFCLIVSGSIQSITLADSLISFLLYFLLVTSQVARESKVWSEHGQRLKESLFFERFKLRYGNPFISEEGGQISPLSMAFCMLRECNTFEADSSYLTDVSPHVYALALQNSQLGDLDEISLPASLRSEIDNYVASQNTGTEEDDNENINKKFALHQLSPNKVLPLLFAFAWGLTPMVVRYFLPNESSILSGDSGIEAFAQVMECLYIVDMIYCENVVVLVDGLRDTTNQRRYAKWLESSLKDCSEVDTCTIRLDSSNNVDAFANLYRFASALNVDLVEFHIGAFEIATLIAIFASSLVFAMVLADFPFSVGMVLLFGYGTVTTVIITRVFYSIALTHSILVKRVVRGLHTQRRKNNVEIDYLETLAKDCDEEYLKDLKRANTKISDLCEELVDQHMPRKLWKVLPLNTDNIIKLAGALAASLFTTVLRFALKT